MSLWSELNRRYREIDQRRKQAQQTPERRPAVHRHDSAAGRARLLDRARRSRRARGHHGSEVADFLASGKVRLPNAYRVLNADGSIPDEGMLQLQLPRRGPATAARRARASSSTPKAGPPRDQRLTADALKELLADRAEAEDRTRRSHEASVDGARVQRRRLQPRPGMATRRFRLAQRLAARQPRSRAGYDELKQAVETGYQHKSYAYRGQRLEEFDRFLRRMREGDLVLTPMRGRCLPRRGNRTGALRRVSGVALQPAPRRHAGSTRPSPSTGASCAPQCPALLQSQAYVVDLTEAYEQLAALVPHEAWRRADPRITETAAGVSWLQPGHAGIRRGAC